jgi:hypothetical protein
MGYVHETVASLDEHLQSMKKSGLASKAEAA